MKMHFVILNFNAQHLPNSLNLRSANSNVGSIKSEMKSVRGRRALRVNRELRFKEPFAQSEQVGITLSNTESQQFDVSKIGKDAGQHRQGLLDRMLSHTTFPDAQNILFRKPLHSYLRWWLKETRFTWLSHRLIARPALVLQFNMLNSHCIRISIKVGNSLVLRNPAAKHVVRDDVLPCLVVHLDDDIFTKIFQRDFHARIEVPDLVRPLFELEIMRNASLECDCIEFGTTRRLAAAAWVATLAMLHYFSRPLQCPDFADSSNIFAIPLDAELEVFVWIKARWIDTKFCHWNPLYT